MTYPPPTNGYIMCLYPMTSSRLGVGSHTIKPTIDETPAQPVPKKTYTPATEEVRGKRRLASQSTSMCRMGRSVRGRRPRPWSEDTTNKAINFFDEGEVD